MDSRKLKRRKEENIIQRIWSKNLLPIILFIMIFLNYFTLIKLNYNTKESFAAGTDTLVPAFGIGFIILCIFYIKKIKISKAMIIQFVILLSVTIMWAIVQYLNVKTGTYYLYDIFNIACKFVNVLFLFVLLMNMELDEKYIYNFMRLMIVFGIVSCVYNYIIYKEDILASLKIITIDTKIIESKSFFAQKNQFAYVLFTCVVSAVILIAKTPTIKSKVYRVLRVVFYIACILLFLFNMVFTQSRTGLVVTALFLGLYLIFTDRIKILPKIALIIILGIVGYKGISYLYEYNPELLMDKLIRVKSIDTLTGRTNIWDVALSVAKESKQTLIFGAGRFNGVEAINNAKLPFTQFHNTYIEFLVSGGIIELVYFISIYLFVFVKVIISKKMDKRYKIIYVILYITYFIYMISESLGRFSIGGSDCLGIIFFITIPLLHSNSIAKIDKCEIQNSTYLENENIEDIEGKKENVFKEN